MNSVATVASSANLFLCQLLGPPGLQGTPTAFSALLHSGHPEHAPVSGEGLPQLQGSSLIHTCLLLEAFSEHPIHGAPSLILHLLTRFFLIAHIYPDNPRLSFLYSLLLPLECKHLKEKRVLNIGSLNI